MKEFGGKEGIPLFRTIRATAEHYNLSERAVRRLVKENRVKFIKCGNRVYINQEHLRTIFDIKGENE